MTLPPDDSFFPPSDPLWPADDPSAPQAWMIVEDVFHITGRGTVVTGQLQGNVPLSVGDTLICEGQRWEVSGIEQFRKLMTTAQPSSQIGVLLSKGPKADALRGLMVQFETKAAGQSGSVADQAGPQFTVLPEKKRRWRR